MSLQPEALSAKIQATNLPENYYKLMIENLTDYAVFMLDTTGHIASWNAGAELIKQYSAEDIIGKHFSTFYTKEDIDRDYPATELEEAIRLGRYEDEGWRIKKDGSVFWANVIITPVYDHDGVLVGFSKVTRDQSAKKKSESELYEAFKGLQESEERFRLLIEGVTDYAIYMLDPAGNVASWNEGARRMKGYESEEIIGKYFARFFGREAIKNGFPEYELSKAKADGRFEDEGWRYRKDGTAFWANTILTAIYNAKKELVGFSKITRDLSEKKKLEQQLFRINEDLKESEEKSRLLIDSVKDYAILMLNPDGIIMSWNSGAERIKGYKASEIIGKHFSTFYNLDAVKSGFPEFELRTALANGQFEDEGWRIRKDGTAFWANVVISPIYNQDNRLLGFAKVTRDLTERRRNEELMRRNKELMRINNELDSFVYTASHDLKSPITNLEGLLTALEEDMGTDVQKYSQIIGMMGGAIKSLKTVITDLTDITRLQQEERYIESIHLPALVVEVRETLRDMIATSKAAITVDFSGFTNLSFSRKNLRSILYNLVSNGIKYSDPTRAPEISITTTVAETGEYVLSVKDNGLGIAENHQDKIFAMFKRVHDHVEGSGVGLYLVKKILDNSGDRITVESELGKGSVFNVYFKH
ncbi:PAS domain-containing sensor histidine kinase [Pontibacter sp. H249]|uniref:PAS domain-containing sensor histidine kinase n=1 Tax=Pontibacter sp. H249 TaxID=3133420 RepID=UPI0030C4704C